MSEVKITYLGHACFCLESQGYRTVLDPYEDNNVPGLPSLHVDAEAVYCSHGHGDHNAVQNVNLQKTEAAAPYTVSTFVTPHDHHEGTKRGMNTVHIFDFDGLRVAHMGDVGRPLTEKEMEKVKGVDCMLIPVGGFFTISAAEAKAMADAAQPTVLIPMHYRREHDGYPVIAPVSDFTALCTSVTEGGSEFTLTKDAAKQVLVMKPNI